jgi:hypothetical protein
MFNKQLLEEGHVVDTSVKEFTEKAVKYNELSFNQAAEALLDAGAIITADQLQVAFHSLIEKAVANMQAKAAREAQGTMLRVNNTLAQKLQA